MSAEDVTTPNIRGNFEVRETGPVAWLKSNIMFSSYVLVTFFIWAVYGSFVRRAYRRAQREGRVFYVDCLPFGRKKDAT